MNAKLILCIISILLFIAVGYATVSYYENITDSNTLVATNGTEVYYADNDAYGNEPVTCSGLQIFQVS